MRWIRLHTQETVYGTTFQELDLETRGLWFSLLAMAGLPPTEGVVELRKGVPYEMRTLASFLNCTTKRLNICLAKLAQVDKIAVEDDFIHIVNWKKYQTRYAKYYAEKNGSDMPQNQHTENAAGECQTDVEVDVEVDKEVTTVVHSETPVQHPPLLPETVVTFFKRRPNGRDEEWEFAEYVTAQIKKHGTRVVEQAMRAFERRAASGGIACPASYLDELIEERLKEKRKAEAVELEMERRRQEDREEQEKRVAEARRALEDPDYLRTRAACRARVRARERTGRLTVDPTEEDWEWALAEERKSCEAIVANHDDDISHHRDCSALRATKSGGAERQRKDDNGDED